MSEMISGRLKPDCDRHHERADYDETPLYAWLRPGGGCLSGRVQLPRAEPAKEAPARTEPRPKFGDRPLGVDPRFRPRSLSFSKRHSGP